ncbi:AAA domain-containing protein, partial [Vibrio anguillarum]
MPIRRLLNKSGRVIQQIKPVFMMSPMSIATYLEPGVIDFDLVIFDEASQVKVADALGAIMRGKQVIVVGDTKQ